MATAIATATEVATPAPAITNAAQASASAIDEVGQLWLDYKANPDNKELRNRLVERYLPLVKYNGERIWARLPEGVELDDLISAGVFGLMDAIDAGTVEFSV